MSVSTYLNAIAEKAILSDDEKASINRSLSTLKMRLVSYFGSTISSHYQFGSFDRGTILPRNMDTKSDVDYLVLFSDGNLKPQTYLDRLTRFISAKYSTSEVFQSHPTIQLELNHMRFELVPAVNDWFGGLQIPSKKEFGYQTWIGTEPRSFNSSLIEKNTNHNFRIKPLVRLVKYWNAENGYPFESFELEQMVVNKSYGFFDIGYSEIKTYFFHFMDDFSSWGAPQWKQIKVARAQKIIAEVKMLEANGKHLLAETEIRKLIPPVSLSITRSLLSR